MTDRLCRCTEKNTKGIKHFARYGWMEHVITQQYTTSKTTLNYVGTILYSSSQQQRVSPSALVKHRHPILFVVVYIRYEFDQFPKIWKMERQKWHYMHRQFSWDFHPNHPYWQRERARVRADARQRVRHVTDASVPMSPLVTRAFILIHRRISSKLPRNVCARKDYEQRAPANKKGLFCGYIDIVTHAQMRAPFPNLWIFQKRAPGSARVYVAL